VTGAGIQGRRGIIIAAIVGGVATTIVAYLIWTLVSRFVPGDRISLQQPLLPISSGHSAPSSTKVRGSISCCRKDGRSCIYKRRVSLLSSMSAQKGRIR